MTRVNQEGGLIDIITMVNPSEMEKKQIGKIEATIKDKKGSDLKNHAVPSVNMNPPKMEKSGT